MRGRGKVLVVDDDVMIRDALAVVLGEHHDVTVAASVRQARALLDAPGAMYDVVVCDLQLGDGTAPEVHAELARHPTGAPQVFVVMTGGAGASPLADFARGAPHVLVKPFDFDDALALIDRALDAR